MNNLWYILGMLIFSIVFTIGFTIYACIAKPKHYIFCCLFLIILVIIVVINNIPFIQDAFKQETTVVIARYIGHQAGKPSGGKNEMFFETPDRRLTLVGAHLSKIVAKMEEGEMYEIEYFNNSKLIKEYRLIK